MDWATNDYTRTYADTIFVPEPEYDTGVHLLDEAGPDSGDAVDSRIRAPIRPYGEVDGIYGKAVRRGVAATPYNDYRTREGFYTGGNIISSRRGKRAIFDAAWDERPLHYSPHAGTDWAHLVPPPSLRPPGGGPAPNLAFPMITPSEGLNKPKDLFTGGCSANGDGACNGSCSGRTVELVLQVFKVVLLVIIVILLAMALMSAGRLAQSLEKMIKESVATLRHLGGQK